MFVHSFIRQEYTGRKASIFVTFIGFAPKSGNGLLDDFFLLNIIVL